MLGRLKFLCFSKQAVDHPKKQLFLIGLPPNRTQQRCHLVSGWWWKLFFYWRNHFIYRTNWPGNYLELKAQAHLISLKKGKWPVFGPLISVVKNFVDRANMIQGEEFWQLIRVSYDPPGDVMIEWQDLCFFGMLHVFV